MLGHPRSLDACRPRASLFMEMLITLLIIPVSCTNPATLANRKLTDDPFSPASIPASETSRPGLDVTSPQGVGKPAGAVVRIAPGSGRPGFPFRSVTRQLRGFGHTNLCEPPSPGRWSKRAHPRVVGKTR